MNVKRRKQVGMHRKTLVNVQASVRAFAKQHGVKPEDVRFEKAQWGRGVWLTVTTPETPAEVEKRKRAEAAERKRRAADKRRREKFQREREAEQAVNTLTTSAEKITRLHNDLAEAVVTVLEANPRVKAKVMKKVGT